MTSCRRVGSFFFAAAFPLLAAACGGGSTAVMGPETGPAQASSGGATIQGTVQTGAVAASSRGAVRALDSSSGIRVSVVGAGLSTVTDGSGRFTLSGVPSGRAELRFEAPGIDARLEIEGLVAGQTLTITVRLEGSGAVLVRPVRRERGRGGV